jgi:hypothetical protein
MRSVGFTVSVKKILYIGGTKSVKFVEKINFVRIFPHICGLNQNNSYLHYEKGR